MILDSIKARGFYAFFNGMKFSGTLGLYLVALFMCLGFEVKAVDLPVHAVYEDQHNGKDVTSTADGNLFILDLSAWNFNNPWSLTEGNVDRNKLTNIVFDSNNSSQVSNISISNDGKISGRKENYKHIIYYNGSNWCIVETYKVGSWYNENNNNFQWKQEDESALISILNNLAQDPNGGSGCNKPTINTNSIQNVSAGTTLSQITISVNNNGNAITGHQWKVNGVNQNDNYVLQAGQTYSLTYEVTNGCGTSSKDYTVTIPSVPTISNVPTPNAQCASNQINIQTPSVDYHGSNANGSCWQYKNNNNQWEDISSSTRLSVGTYSVRYIARSSNGQTATSDETSLTINDKPTINTSTISTPSAGSTLSSVTISVDANGSNITSQVWKKDGNNIDPNSLTFQAGQTYNLTYEVTNGCGTSSKDSDCCGLRYNLS